MDNKLKYSFTSFSATLYALYNKSKFEELLSLTSKKFEPIMVTMSDEALENTFSYISEELLKQIPSESEKEKLLTEKNNHDYKALEIKYRIFFNRKPDNINHRAKYSKDKQIIQKEKTIYCYKYLSRFNDFDKYLDGVYTDYFGKQVLYGVLKSTSSRLGIHGCYSLIVPQKNIIPDEIIKSAIEEANSNIKIELIK